MRVLGVCRVDTRRQPHTADVPRHYGFQLQVLQPRPSVVPK